ncbi:MAG: hypothetical protein A3I75_02715 [Deltaproteobacteria bacterium RIFCSPLOWO2_02_FULL_50_16]|nr:MAG: hypothetical protein A3B79_05215 [Deltaproteobacteria bacterium RIFCSPHIGHO2_02_FULL_50_15]OGQ56135.1 MAG: hypothetical protein A3I75_02715 [Deltaproteobacteria bacterium RIFCSPLOWO2_02_FULL_50_16]OGQ66017.1 MAG: hypothetical protein A3F89_04720 [Deltaproteobacteria bacterium RIFCSPLOWO2_12_FULL_50_11]
MHNGSKTLLILCVLSLTYQGCSLSKTASDITSKIFETGAPYFERESDPYVAEQAGLAMLKTLEIFWTHNRKNRVYTLLLAKNYANYAFGILETEMIKFQEKNPAQYETLKERAQLFYSRGKWYGMTILNRNKKFKQTVGKDLQQFQKIMGRYKRGDADAVFWTAFAWGSLINLNKDDPMSITELGFVEAMMSRVMEVNSTFFYGGPHLFYGVYYASRPAMLGGNPEKAKKEFENSIQVTKGRFLMAKTLMAQFYAVQVQDRALFQKLLQEVQGTDPNIFPDQRLANVMARIRAGYLINRANEYF